jgi:hypothetical protein
MGSEIGCGILFSCWPAFVFPSHFRARHAKTGLLRGLPFISMVESGGLGERASGSIQVTCAWWLGCDPGYAPVAP